jgi:hypothetical protein
MCGDEIRNIYQRDSTVYFASAMLFETTGFANLGDRAGWALVDRSFLNFVLHERLFREHSGISLTNRGCAIY